MNTPSYHYINVDTLSEEEILYYTNLFEHYRDDTDGTIVPETDVLRPESFDELKHGDVVVIGSGRRNDDSMILFYNQPANRWVRAAPFDDVPNAAIPLELNALIDFRPHYWSGVLPEITIIETGPLAQLLGNREITEADLYLSQVYDRPNRRTGQLIMLPLNLNGDVYYVIGTNNFDIDANLDADTFIQAVLDTDGFSVVGVDDEIPDLGVDPEKVLMAHSF